MSTESSGRTVTREELFDRVWKTPVSKLASDFGVSDVAIAKTCKRLNVPRPPRGYWAKLEAGKRVKRPKLPPVSEGAPASAVIGAFQSKQIHKPTAFDPASLPKIAVPEDLRGCHPLVSATRKALESTTPDGFNRVNVRTPGVLGVNVSKDALIRALRLMEALIRACEERGWKVEGSSGDRATRILLGADPVSLTLTEKVEREEVKPTPEEKKHWYFTRYKYAPTARLTLQITDYLGNHDRTKWADGKATQLEAMLPEVVAGIEVASAQLRELRLAREQQHRQWEEQQRRREDLVRRIKIERVHRTRLEVEASGWEKANAIRAMCDEVERRAKANSAIVSSEAVERWLAWARAIAAKHDPFENGYLVQAINTTGLDAALDCSKDYPGW